MNRLDPNKAGRLLWPVIIALDSFIDINGPAKIKHKKLANKWGRCDGPAQLEIPWQPQFSLNTYCDEICMICGEIGPVMGDRSCGAHIMADLAQTVAFFRSCGFCTRQIGKWIELHHETIALLYQRLARRMLPELADLIFAQYY